MVVVRLIQEVMFHLHAFSGFKIKGIVGDGLLIRDLVQHLLHVEYILLESGVDKNVQNRLLVTRNVLILDLVHNHEEVQEPRLTTVLTYQPRKVIYDLVDSVQAYLLVVAEQLTE